MGMYERMARLAEATPSWEIPIQEGLVWSLRTAPHALISGTTGYGKSYFVTYLLAMASIKGCALLLCDPKNADLASLSAFMPPGRVAWDADGIRRIVGEAVEAMSARYAYMRREREARGLFQADFADFGLAPVLLVIEELAAFVSSLDRRARESFDADIKAVTLQGRQAGVSIISVMQSPNASNLATEARAQMGFKAYLGSSGGIEYRMLFGEGHAYPARLYRPGQGLYMMAGVTDGPELIETPRMDKAQLGDAVRSALAPQYSIDPLAALGSRSGAEAGSAAPSGTRGTDGADYDAPFVQSAKGWKGVG